MKSLFYIFTIVSILLGDINFDSLELEVSDAKTEVSNLDKTNIKDIKKEEVKLLSLEKKLQNIKNKLVAKNNLDNLKLNPFVIKIKSALNERGLDKGITSLFRQGDILEFSSSLKYPDSNESIKTVIQWELFDKNNKEVDGYFKENIVNYKGISKQHNYKIRLGKNLKNGKYTVALSHFLQSNPKIYKQASKSFILKQDIEILGIQLANSPTDTKYRKVFYNDENPHMYVNFKLASNIKKVKVFLTATNQNGVELYGYKGERKRKGESQRAGIKISKLKVGDIVTFSALLIGEDGYTIEKSENFKVSSYALSIVGDFDLKSNQTKRFRVKVPRKFEKPFKVHVDYNSNYKAFVSKRLNGIIIASNNSSLAKNEWLYITVVDKNGRRAFASESVTIKGKPEKKVVVHKPTPKVIKTPKPTFVVKTIKHKPKIIKKKYVPVKRELTRGEKIAIGEKKYYEIIDYFTKGFPSCISAQLNKALKNGIKDQVKLDYVQDTAEMGENNYRKDEIGKIIYALFQAIIKENIYNECSIRVLAHLNNKFPRNVVYKDKVISIRNLAFILLRTEKDLPETALGFEGDPRTKFIRKLFHK